MTKSVNTPISVTVSKLDAAIRACVEDHRVDTVELFAELEDSEAKELALDAWSIGLRALGNAYSRARESRLEDVGKTLLDDMKAELQRQLATQEKTVTDGLKRFFDPTDGQVSQRLDAFVADEGVLARFLEARVGGDNSMLAKTLADQVGANSELFKKLSPTEKDGVVQILESRLEAVLAESQSALLKALNPLDEEGAIGKLLRTLRKELEDADEDRAAQLNKALAALDANDDSSLISRLMRETQGAKETLLRSLNPDDPESALGTVKRTVEQMLQAHGQTQKELFAGQEARHKELEILIRETVAKMEARKQADAVSPRGGATFEDSVVGFVEDATRGGTYIVEATGNTTGKRSKCKVGDVVVEFGAESAFKGCRVVVEAKRDASYTLAKALEEMEVAKANRDATIGIFVFASSHAPAGFPGFERYGSTIIVTWDSEDPASDPSLRGAILAALAMATRRATDADAGDLEALADVEKRISGELKRVARMRKANEKISQHSGEIEHELRTGQRKLELLLDSAKDALRALNVELVEDAVEAATPVSLPVAAAANLNDSTPHSA